MSKCRPTCTCISYICPTLVEHDSVIWSPYTVKVIEHIESVQRRFTKRLPGFGTLPYADRLRRLNLPSLELRRLHTDLIYCYKIVFGLTDLPPSDYFQMAPLLNTRRHKFKLHKKRCSAIVRCKFFSEHVVNTWNNLPSSVDFSSLSNCIRTVKLTDLSDYLRCF